MCIFYRGRDRDRGIRYIFKTMFALISQEKGFPTLNKLLKWLKILLKFEILWTVLTATILAFYPI